MTGSAIRLAKGAQFRGLITYTPCVIKSRIMRLYSIHGRNLSSETGREKTTHGP
jgi:hypothetical protein